MTPSDCPVCGAQRSSPIVCMEQVPLFCNVRHAERETAQAAELGTLDLVGCLECGVAYNRAFDAERVRYAPSYDNAQHFSPTFRRYLEQCAAELVRAGSLEDQDVLEIGCGDGAFLAALCEAGAGRGLGFDPAAPPGAGHARVELRREALQAPVADFDPRLLAFRHVLEHIAEPRAFLESLSSCVPPSCRWYCEVPDARSTFVDGAIWDLLYEHCTYFDEDSLRGLFERAGFEVLSSRRVFSDQFVALQALRRRAEGELRAREQRAVDQRGWTDFSERHRRTVERWRTRLEQWAREGRRVALWGAGTKGVMFLHSCQADATVAEVVDISPRKHGTFVPGTAHPVRPPEHLRQHPVEVVIVMNASYRDEIARTLEQLGQSPQLETA